MRLRIAEVLLAFIFVAGGLSTPRNPGLRAEQIARFRFPFADLSVRVNAVFMVIAGVALALNFHASIASASLAALLVPTTIFGHAFGSSEARPDKLRWPTSSKTLVCWADFYW